MVLFGAFHSRVPFGFHMRPGRALRSCGEVVFSFGSCSLAQIETFGVGFLNNHHLPPPWCLSHALLTELGG